MSEYYLVDVKSITSPVPRSTFREDELEQLAHQILEAGGLLSPVLLKQTGIDSYEVLAGDRTYYAAVRAREINPRAAEMVNAFVIPTELVEAALDQVKGLQGAQTTIAPEAAPGPSPLGQSPSPVSAQTDQRLTNLESRLDAGLRDLKQTQQQELQRLEKQIMALQQEIPASIEPLEGFNQGNAALLLQKLAMVGVRGKTAEKLITAIETARAQAPFTSYTDVVNRVSGLSDKRMLNLLDAWNGRF